MSEYKRHSSSITPAPVSREQPATMGDVWTVAREHADECSEERRAECVRRDAERADKDGIFWARVVALEALVGRIDALVTGIIDRAEKEARTRLAIAALALTLLGTMTAVGIFVAKYAIVGAITIELDKRIPPGMRLNLEAQPEPGSPYAQLLHP